MYRQVTVPELNKGGVVNAQTLKTPLIDVENAFQDYLKHFNKGRPFILIGHSQGSFLLRQLIAQQIDAKPLLRARLLSAILLGGNVLVKTGSEIGGDFKHIPGCTSATQLGCVIAFSSFDQTPPPNALFGRTTTPGDSVLCTNPAALGGGSGTLDSIWPSAPFAPGTLISFAISLLNVHQPTPPTVFFSEPGAYSAQCSSAAGANVLQITANGGAQVASRARTRRGACICWTPTSRSAIWWGSSRRRSPPISCRARGRGSSSAPPVDGPARRA
jgi:hypothetical protein